MEAEKTERVRSIGHYILAKTIGEGTFGKVKLGTHILTGENVAVKILEKERIVDVADVERVAREIHILKLIRHPHIIQLYEIIETPRQLYLIMEYASGGELFDYIVKHSRVKETEAVKFFRQILVGVEKVHEINVVHRDLKPENLLLDEQKNIKIVDFGLSNTHLPGQLLKTACGSPCYAAPEMIAGHRYVPAHCDMWSCGVILFALLCGYLPFEDQNTSNLYRKIMNAEYRCPSFVSKNGRDLIQRLLTTDPTERITPRMIQSHPWYMGLIRVNELKDRPPDLQFYGNGCRLPQCQRCQQEKPNCYIDDEVLNQLVELGFPKEYATRCLQLNKHNHATTTYYLLLAKKTRLRERLQIDNATREKFGSVATGTQPSGASHTPRAPFRPQIGLNLRPQIGFVTPRATSPNFAGLRPLQGITTPRAPVLSARISAREAPTVGTPTVCAPIGIQNVAPTRTPTAGAPTGIVTPRTPMARIAPRLSAHYNPPARSLISARQTPPTEPPKRAIIGARPSTAAPLTAREPIMTEAIPAKLPLSARGPATWTSVRKVGGVHLSTRERYRSAFSFSSVSRKPLKQAMSEVKRTLAANRVEFKQTSPTVFLCQRPSLRFDVEMKEEGPSTYVRLTRVSGELWLYNDTCSKLLAQMRL